MSKDDKILFGMKVIGYQFLSNFYPCEMTIDGKVYRHVEGYYQSCKWIGIDDDLADNIRRYHSPYGCKKLAYRYKLPTGRKEEWECGQKLEVMKYVVWEKFSSNSILKDKLLDTGSKELIEDAPWDPYWGNGPDGKGQNMLGKILMEVRDKLNIV